MGRRRSSRAGLFLRGTLIFIVMFVVAVIGVQFLTKTGIFHVPGVVTYDESLNENEMAVLGGIFTDEVELDKDVTVSANVTLCGAPGYPMYIRKGSKV